MSSKPRLIVENPRCDELLEELQKNDGVAFCKRTHGVWDHLGLLVTGGWSAEAWRRCDMMIYKRVMGKNPACQTDRLAYVNYLEELHSDVLNPPNDSRWWQTISLDIDYITKKLDRPRLELRLSSDPRLLSYWEWNYSYADVFADRSLLEHRWRFAQTLTQGIKSLAILDLPTIAREFHVVTIGPEKCKDLDRRWDLSPGYFTFIAAPQWPERRPNGSIFNDPVLPALQTFRLREDLLRRLLLIESDRSILYLFELGTCAQWLIYRLFAERPKQSYLDMGRTLELWYPEHEWPLKSKTSALYRRAARNFYGERRYHELVSVR